MIKQRELQGGTPVPRRHRLLVYTCSYFLLLTREYQYNFFLSLSLFSLCLPLFFHSLHVFRKTGDDPVEQCLLQASGGLLV